MVSLDSINEKTDISKEKNETLHSEKCTFDLRNLLATNGHQVDISQLYQPTSEKKATQDISISSPAVSAVNEEYLLQKASEGCQQLITELWSLPQERKPEVIGPLAILPNEFAIRTPRELPPPKPKPETKWERFAKERGILPQRKRERKVFDEATQTWKFRHGYDRTTNNSTSDQWPIMEVKAGDNPYDDPWEKARDAKKTRMDRNLERQLANQERNGMVPRGTARRVATERESRRQAGREAGAKDTVSERRLLPAGVPVDLTGAVKRGKDLTTRALVASQRSTASLGKFDGMREGEPERKKAIRKRKFESVADKKVVTGEAVKGMKVLERVMNGGKERDRDARKGRLAKGETAYDYEYDDGLGPQSYKKKKGRAGAGKMKKMTKKRIK